SSASNIRTRVVGDDIQIELADNLRVDRVAIKGGGPVLSASGINMRTNRIRNLEAGVDDTDAVNVAQLKDSAWTISAEGGTPDKIRAEDNVDFKALDSNTSVAYDETSKTMTIGVIDAPVFSSVT